MGSGMTMIPKPPDRSGLEQEQFLKILSREDAIACFEAALFPWAIPSEARKLADTLGTTLAEDITAPIDVPPFDRSNVDGFAVRAADLATAGEAAPARLALNGETIHCGTAPTMQVAACTATPIATGGPLPRGADAVVMVEHTQPAGSDAIDVRRAVSPGQFVSYAGSDIARGEALLRAGTVIGSREIGMLSTAIGTSPWPVMTTMGSGERRSISRSCSSRPVMPAMRMSTIKQATSRGSYRERKDSAESKQRTL